MARVATYQRNVNVVLTDIFTGPTNNIENQNGIKIKEEPVDTTVNTFTTEDCTLENNNDLIEQNKSLQTGDSYEVINNKETEHLSDSNFVYLNNKKECRNLKRKRTKDAEKQTYNTLSPSTKRRKCSNKVSKDTTSSCTTLIENFKKMRKKRTKIGMNMKVKIHRKTKPENKGSVQCDVCFRDFDNQMNLEFHVKYYKGVFICKNCNSYYETQSKLVIHSKTCNLNPTCNMQRWNLLCNFCNRKFKVKYGLQSHLFHSHGELIYSDNTDICKPASENLVNTYCQNDTLKINAHEESSSTNLVESKNLNKSFKNDTMKTTNSNSEESLSTAEMLSSKKLRQPTLMEYLELYKRNYNTKNYQRDLDDTKNDLSMSATNTKDDNSLSTKSNLKKPTTNFTLKQDTNREPGVEQPLVTLHANVETMISCFKKDPNVIAKKEIISNHVDDTILYDRNEIPYSLRSFQSSSSTRSNSKKTRTRNSSKKWKTIMTRFKCKNCTVLLTRCDKKPNNDDQIPIVETTKEDVSLNTQSNSCLFQETDIQAEVVFKTLEVSLERIKPVPALDLKARTVSDVEYLDDKCYTCSVCKKSFSSKENKHMHIKSCHIAYMSSICNARYTSKHSLLQHYLCEHLLEQTQCCVCYTSFSDYEALKEHLNIHCLKYIYKETDKYAVDVETKCNSNNENYECCYCNNIFSSQSTLMIHQNQCTTQKQVENEKSMVQEIENEKSTVQELNKEIVNIISEEEHNNNADGTTLPDKEIISNDLCEVSNNSKEISIMRRISESEKEVNFEDDNQPSFLGNLLSSIQSVIVDGSETITENSERSLDDSLLNKDVLNIERELTEINTNIYPCSICGKQFQSSKNLQQHIRSFSNTTDVCPLCETAFSSKRLLQSHIVAAHVPQISKTYNFHCMFCNQGFVKKYELRPHVLHLHGQQMFRTFMRDSHNNPDNLDGLCTGVCDICNIKFETRDRYAEHRMYYYKNHKFTCSICRKDFQGMYMFHHHYKLAHYSENKRNSYKYICDICNEGFNHESHFHSHKMHVHVNKETSIAIAKKSENRKLIDHAFEVQKIWNTMEQRKGSNHLSTTDEYVCTICEIKYTNIDDILNHIVVYSTSGNFKCDKCDRQCKTRDVLEQHKKLTHICRDVYNGYLCHICGEILETITSLQCHEKHFHSNAKSIENQSNTNNNKYRCLFCGLTFLSADIVQKHINVDHNDILAKHFTLRPVQFTSDNNVIQKKSVQQLVQVNQTLSGNNPSTQSLTKRSNNIALDMTIQNSNNTTITKSYYKHQVKHVFENNYKEKLTQEKPTSAIVSSSENHAIVSSSENHAIVSSSEVNISSTSATSTATTSSNESKVATSVPSSIELFNEPQSRPSIFLNSSKNDCKINSISLTNNSANPVITVPVTSATGVLKIILANKQDKKIKSVKQAIESASLLANSCNYVCPVCSLVYPSLMFFHAHLIYAHASYIRNDTCRLQSTQTSSGQLISVDKSIPAFSAIECLLCPAIFTNETSYKIHLKNFHTRRVIALNETINSNNANNASIVTTNQNKKDTNPEIITIDDDDNNIETSIKDPADKTTATTDIIDESLSENIGKLRVKPFAKIIENPLSAETLK
ncbi:zinc finger protein 423-like [Pseudomyrmex gracilis]|uniref:zinc finger protein 423-like n=1 Tax=Pseudomyrmex gracilis TaxID=219809 RepID=UPI000994FCC6|nr:zinc finger protein 423-like [Pseudomyrmex gracilis]XP_020291431.1 zinc finger protein 423-like [Pseudomyrmex gracilis]